jgi:hypothetical protein
MNLLKEEKKFWQRYFRVEKLEAIPKEWQIIGGVGCGDEQFDDYFYYISLRVNIVHEIHLKDSLVTDAGVAHMCYFKGLKTLFLKKHDEITKESIPYFNKMESLKSLNITKTKITLTDLSELLNNQSLKEVFISSDEKETDILEKAFILKEKLPNCDIYLNTCFTTDSFGNPENPIF